MNHVHTATHLHERGHVHHIYQTHTNASTHAQTHAHKNIEYMIGFHTNAHIAMYRYTHVYAA